MGAYKEEISSELLGDEVFALLRREGPLCPSQISTRLFVRIDAVNAALKILASKGVVQQREDKEGLKAVSEAAIPWGLPIVTLPTFLKRLLLLFNRRSRDFTNQDLQKPESEKINTTNPIIL